MLTSGCLAVVASSKKSRTTLFDSGELLIETGVVENGELVLILDVTRGGPFGYTDAWVVSTTGQMGWICEVDLDIVAMTS